MEMLLWLSDSRGIYIPRDFANSFADRAKSVSGVSDHDWAVLEDGPNYEWYWSAWDNVCSNAVVTIDGVKYFVHQDGDCWLVPVGMVWDDKTDTFIWESEE